MQNIAVFFGGESSEHDISVITALEVIRNMPSSGYCCVPIYVRERRLYTGRELLDFKAYMPFEGKKHVEVALIGKTLYMRKRSGAFRKYAELDCAVIAMHGGLGEGGGLQGILETSGIPYTSAGIAASALCLDKYRTKIFLKGLGVPVLDGVIICREYSENDIKSAEDIGYPLFVKPNSQGSSIGAGVANDRRELVEKLKEAHAFDECALVEHCVSNADELNVGIVNAYGKYIVSEAERPRRVSEFLSFEDKYMSGSAGDMSGAEREFPAILPENTRQKLREISEIVARELVLSGVVRIDFIREGENLYLNEINTVPGSLAHYLFPEYDYTFFLKILIENALIKGVRSDRVYSTDVLNKGKGKGR